MGYEQVDINITITITITLDYFSIWHWKQAIKVIILSIIFTVLMIIALVLHVLGAVYNALEGCIKSI